jgi:SET domain
MYKDHCELRHTKTGLGVFTKSVIPVKAPIMEIRGPLYSEKELPDPNHPALLQVGPDTFIGPSGDFDDYLNHSCNPNCFLHIAGTRAILFSLYVIPPNTELTFDYSSTSTDELEKWKMNCACGDFKCRKVISGHQHLDPAIKQKMTAQGMFPLYILHPEMFPKRW